MLCYYLSFCSLVGPIPIDGFFFFHVAPPPRTKPSPPGRPQLQQPLRWMMIIFRSIFLLSPLDPSSREGRGGGGQLDR